LPSDTADGTAGRRWLSVTVSVIALLLVWFALVFPDRLSRLTTPGAFVRLPLEGVLIVALGLLLPRRTRWVMAAVAGIALGLFTLLKIFDLGFLTVLGRPFNALTDWGYLRSGAGVLRDSVGPGWTVAAVVGATLLLGAVLVTITRSVMRLVKVTGQHGSSAVWVVSVLGAAWLLSALLGVQVAGAPVAATSADGLMHVEVDKVLAVPDPFANTPSENLLTGLRGKDVLIVFVESYGRVAVQDSGFSPQVDAVLESGTRSLRTAGFSSRSAFLTSPTFAGISWLAHSTLQSGLWIDDQLRYNQLLASDRLTLSASFKRAGWRTIGDVPSNDQDWPEGASFYHYDKIYDGRNVGYTGPSFSYAAMPDQYTLAAFQRNELANPRHAPVMAEIDLVSSHGPWTPLPHLVDWTKVGNGSIFNDMPTQGQLPSRVFRDPTEVKAAYGRSIQYSIGSLISFLQTYPDKNLVVVMVGDHQPAAVVSGSGASHDVPITIIAHDPLVMDRIAPWGWQEGMLPSPQASVWRMDEFRDRFLTAFGPARHTPSGSASPR
jgi:hypothetical protein